MQSFGKNMSYTAPDNESIPSKTPVSEDGHRAKTTTLARLRETIHRPNQTADVE